MEDDNDAIIAAPPRTKIGVAVVVFVFHAVAILALIRAFAPGLTAQAVNTIVTTFTVTVTTTPPEPATDIEKAGASGEQGKKATAREVKADKPRVAIAKVPAPKAASTGNADSSGARDSGTGTGAGGSGSGTGSGTGGDGAGGGSAGKAVHIAGQINNARDFPVPPGGREARIGKSVILALTVNTDGQATACRIYRSSGLAETDEVTCRLAKQRLRFRPATNSLGEPIVSTFYWQQKFFF